jgi:hypothetical protein
VCHLRVARVRRDVNGHLGDDHPGRVVQGGGVDPPRIRPDPHAHHLIECWASMCTSRRQMVTVPGALPAKPSLRRRARPRAEGKYGRKQPK